jgi:hypothetical protein
LSGFSRPWRQPGLIQGDRCYDSQRHRDEPARVQRERQQGLGKPIISANFKGTRFIAVKNRLLHSQGWKTFHDFLGDYIRMAVGPDCGNAEIAKPAEQRHPIVLWYQAYCRHQAASARMVVRTKTVGSTPTNGIVVTDGQPRLAVPGDGRRSGLGAAKVPAKAGSLASLAARTRP